MKRLVLLILGILFCGGLWAMEAVAGEGGVGARMVDSAWRASVKTVQLTREGVELEAPVLTMVGPEVSGRATPCTVEKLVLRFDVLADEAENLRYTIAHCDADWHLDDLEPYEFMTGFESGEIENIEPSFATRRNYIHYHQTLPARHAEFIHSGNYVLFVVSDDGGDTLLSRRFRVTEQAVRVEAEVTKPYDGVGLRERQEVDVRVEAGDGWAGGAMGPVNLRPENERILVQQNGREDNARWLAFSGYDGRGLAYRYRPENIFDGGNTFRFFDCANLHTPMYNLRRVEEYGGELFAILEPEEDRSRKHYLSERTLSGGYKVSAVDRRKASVEAEYVWVNLSLPMAQPWLDRSVYVVGDVTDWRLDSTSRMDYRADFKAYTKRLLVKQGYYSYQLLAVGRQIEMSATESLEGDHMETPNRYTVYVYHREPSDRADRLVGVVRLSPQMAP